MCYGMNEPSAEQQLVIDHLQNGDNVICSAVAGSGKSSTVLAAAKQMPGKQILQITYNSSLRLEIREKVRLYGLNNITIHTFHSLAVKYYSPDCHTDTGIRRVLLHNTKPRHGIEPIQLMMLDEFQDCSELYFRLIVKFIRDMGSLVQLLILGDPLQCLYEFKGADSRFLTMAKQIWSRFPLLKSHAFVQCPLKMSYRITDQMSMFVNRAMFGEEMMLSCRSGEPVQYIRNSRYNIEKTVVFTIRELLDNGVKPSDIFVLAASVKGLNSNVRKMENALVECDIPCHVPMFEADKLDDRIIDGKIVFSTFHCAKGRQRKHVFVVGFDNNYFNQFARSIADKSKCPNTLYVGCTRATHGLYLLEFDQYMTDRPLEFLKMGHYDFKKCDFVNFKGTPRSIFYKKDTMNGATSTITTKYETPTKMIKFIPDTTLDIISPVVDRLFAQVSPASTVINVPAVIQTRRGFYEAVSDLNGIAIPFVYTNNVDALRSMVENALLETKESEHMYIKRLVGDLPEDCSSISNSLFLANIYTAIQERLYFKLKQIGRDEYNWITDDHMNACKKRLDDIICVTPGYLVESEQTIIQASNDDQHCKIDQLLSSHFPDNVRFRFTGIVDMITDSCVWELKCSTDISIDHKLQVVVYAWLWSMLDRPAREFKILNILTGEVVVLTNDPDELNNVVIALLKGKYDDLVPKTDAEFVSDCVSCLE